MIGGEQVACRWVRLTCERHRRDLATGHERGLRFDADAGQDVIDWFSFLRHSKGEFAGLVVELEPWQQAMLWILFGWLRADGWRRFRTAYWEVARKNGKSTLAAGLALYLMLGDGEPGAEVYSAATKRSQAKIVFDEATRMVKTSPLLKKRITCFRDNLHIRDTASKFEPLGRDSDTMDGLNVHGGIVDELHAHRDGTIWGVLETGTGSRRQPLMLAITTAGFNETSFCFELRDYACKVLDQVLVDDAFFGVIFTLDDEDLKSDSGWQDETKWIKANPNLGISVKLDDLRDQATKARGIASTLAEFKVKRLNIWTNAAELWMHPDRWRACAGTVDEEVLAGRPCYGGLDLSNTLDLTALALLFPPHGDDPLWRILLRYWCPGDAIRERSQNNRAPYEAWARLGYIEAIPGEVIDYDYIYKGIDVAAQQFDLKEIAFDRWGAAEIYVKMAQQGMTMVQIGQGFQSLSAPMKELERLVMGKRLAHGNNPVLTWNMHNLVALRDPAGNIKPDKRRSREKIDGSVALIMALARATVADPDAGRSVYEERGVRTL